MGEEVRGEERRGGRRSEKNLLVKFGDCGGGRQRREKEEPKLPCHQQRAAASSDGDSDSRRELIWYRVLCNVVLCLCPALPCTVYHYCTIGRNLDI